MPSSDTIRWLHLSDFHTRTQDYAQQEMFEFLLENVQKKVRAGLGPDLIFLTGDIAYSGKPAEYQRFFNSFFDPLMKMVLPDVRLRTFMIPGNHDVDREQAEDVDTYGILSRIPSYLDPDETGLRKRKHLLERFQAYADRDKTLVGKATPHWVFSEQGAYTQQITLAGHTLGILGLNSAWFSKSDEDKGWLSLGTGMLREGLKQIRQCETRIVLAHHPIEWLLDGSHGGEGESEQVRSLLGHDNVIYLHGHLHENTSRPEIGAGCEFLTMQAGASYQARQNMKERNRFLWCVLDYQQNRLEAEPLQWSKNHQEWGVDGDAFPQHYLARQHHGIWHLPLPQSADRQTPATRSGHASPTPQEAHPAGVSDPLVGWTPIDRSHLEEQANRTLTKSQAINYFDGSFPTWQVVLARDASDHYVVPRRSMVNTLLHTLKTARQEQSVAVTVLLGATGEGKTTVLQQVVCSLLTSEKDWQVLWREWDEEQIAPLASVLAHLPQEAGQTWLIVSDEAAPLAGEVHSTIKALAKKSQQPVQFLLCSRDTDWNAAGADRLPWRTYLGSHYTLQRLSGLEMADAQKIVQAWSHFGQEGLRQLSTLPPQEAVHQLVQKAVDKSSRSNAFFGAMLDVRIGLGKGLEDHVQALLERLAAKPAPGGTLLEAFARLAILHVHDHIPKLPSLSPRILATALGCELPQVRPEVIVPLGSEAAIAESARSGLLTRHRKIAEVAVRLIEDKGFASDLQEMFVQLAVAAEEVAQPLSNLVPDIADWRYLSTHLFDAGERELGIRMAQELVTRFPTSGHFTVNLAQLLRRANRLPEALTLFHEMFEQVNKDRAYYFQWGACEGRADHPAVDAYLVGLSLADGLDESRPDRTRVRKSLAGLVTSFGKLVESSRKREPQVARQFLEARAGAVQLGLFPQLHARGDNDNTRQILEGGQRECEALSIHEVLPTIALERMQKGVSAAWHHLETPLPEGILQEDELTFHDLARLLGIL